MKVNIGGQKGRDGFPEKGWKIVDIRKGSDYVVDIMSDKLPFDDSGVDAVYTSHTLEHIFPDRLDFVLGEVYRVLRHGGKIRVVVPDIDLAIKAYVDNNMTYLKDKRNPSKMEWVPKDPVCYLSSWFFTYKLKAEGSQRLIGGHVGVFNYSLLEQYLKNAQFRGIEKSSYGKSDSLFTGCDFKRYKDCSLYVEATK